MTVRDELLGRKIKCGSCGATFMAPRSSGKKGPAEIKGKGVNVSVAWGKVFGLGALAAIVLGIVLIVFGPVAAWKEWEKLGTNPNDDVEEVVTQGLQSYLSQNHMWNPRKPGHTPRATDDTLFIRNMAVMSMPKSVSFKGSSTEGGFKGKYNPLKREVDADVEIGGMSIGGLGAVKKGNTTIKVTGRFADGKYQCEVDGKTAQIYYPPQEDD